ncbi:MAG: tetratricopeptide repeat protein [Ignavibacteriales bacterium]|nr:MAG: tetratricopeptide repeat protein [Ignavibacteriales bacterium]
MKNIFVKSFFVSVLLLCFILISGCAKNTDESKIPVTTASEEARADFVKGRDLSEKLRQQESLQHFENAVAKDKDFAMAYYYHALANPTGKGFFEDLEKLTSLTGKVSEGEKLIILSLKAGVDGNQAKQEEHLNKLVDLYPNDERAHTLLGNFYFGQQKYQQAVDHLKKASEIAPDYSATYNMLGYSYRNLENFDEAEKAFKKYIELIPDDPNPYDSYAEMLLKQGRYDESIEQYKKALNINPNFISSHLGIATNYTFMKKHDEARSQCDALFASARDDGEKRAALFTKTVSYVDEGNIDMAIQEMQKQYEIAESINDAGNMTGDLNAMGNILFDAGRYDEAKEKYDQALLTTLNSDLPEEVKENSKRLDIYNQSRILLMNGKLADSKAKAGEFSERAASAKNTFQIWLSHELNGMIALEEKDFTKAREEFMQSNLQNPYNHYRIALTYSAEGNKEEANKYLESSKNFNALTSLNQAFVRNKAEIMLAKK